ncbi:MAG: GNAT family N-acetyltransferase [Candidatus Competibacteraceae bacterium]|jgi:ribosomal protein S18 acetylase RimI-like enzyme|nr:GNAT family N-acetyltransferase [Candidatus Competibacteraceae bacterium]
MNTVDTLKIELMSPAELNLAIDWAAAEGWNPGLHDANAFYATDPKGFFIGKLNGEPVAVISAVRYDDQFGFLGFYIVHPEHRGKGYGYQLWQAGMAYLGNRNVGLDGVVAEQANYRQSGFQYAYANQRYEGQGGGAFPINVVLLDGIPFEQVLAYDSACFTRPRLSFLTRWIRQPQGAALGVLEGDQLVGYGVIRACRSGQKIGPLFADDADAAEALFQALASTVPGEPLYLDVPRANPAALELVQRHAMKPVFETARMYTQGDPGVPVQRVFGVTSFELG